MAEDTYEEILDLHKEADQMEYELGQLKGDLEDVVDDIEEIDSRLEAENEIEGHQAKLGAEIEELRTKIDRIMSQAVEEFNDHMDSVLAILEYSNLERIWLEHVKRNVREGRQKVTKSVFGLHIVRETDNDAIYEDTLDHLNESEREVTGLVFALSDYLGRVNFSIDSTRRRRFRATTPQSAASHY